MLPGLVEAGLRGGTSALFVRPLSCWASEVLPLDVLKGVVWMGAGLKGGGEASSSIGESGGGGISVPSVREKFRGVSAGSSNLFPFAGMVK